MPWLEGEKALAKLREYEVNILDRYHESLDFWSSPPTSRCYALLAAFDGMLIPELYAASNTHEPAILQLAQNWQDGLLQSVRWLARQSRDLGVLPTRDWPVIDNAGAFLLYAGDYVNVADLHISVGRGLVNLLVDPDQLIVRFEYADPSAALDASSGFLEQCHVLDRLFSARLESQKGATSFLRAQPVFSGARHTLEHGRIVLKDISPLRHHDAFTFVENHVLLDTTSVPGCTDLAGFSLKDYSAFWNALVRMSCCAMVLYLRCVKSGVPQNECMPTQVVSVDEFERRSCSLSGLRKHTAVSIRQRVSMDTSGQKPDVLLTPLVTERNRVAWSPRYVTVAKHIRNLLKSMARSQSYKAIADATIESDEKALLHDLAAILVQEGYSYKLRTNVVCKGQRGEIDMLAWTPRSPSQVLLIEAKAVLEPDEVNEVNQVTDAFLYGQQQLRKSVAILQGLSNVERSRAYKFVAWHKVDEWYGFVYSRHTMPNNRYDHAEFPGTQLSTIMLRVQRRDRKTPSRLVSALRRREWMDEYRGQKTATGHKDVQIGNVLYQLPSRSKHETEEHLV